MRPGQALTVPLRLANPTDRELLVTVTVALPRGWKDAGGPRRLTVAPRATVVAPARLVAPATESAPAALRWRAESAGEVIGTVELRAATFAGAMPL